MADFLKILESKIDFSPTESGVAERWFRQVERDSLFANAISSSGGGAGVTSVDAGNVAIDLSEGLTIKNPDTGDNTIRFDPDGDAWFGKNIGDPDTTTMFIISNAQVYNTELFGEGDLLIGSNSSGKGNMWWDASIGKLYFRSGQTTSVEIGDGGIVATWGKIGGWNINAADIRDDSGNIILDSANEKIYVGAGIILDGPNQLIQVGSSAPTIEVDGGNKRIRSSNYSPGAAGFQLDATDGDAEFNNITARGTFKTSVFQKDNIIATGGSILVSQNAGEVNKDVTTPDSLSSFTLEMKDDDADDVIAAVDDVLLIKGWNGADLVVVWMTVTAVVPGTGYSTYTVDLEHAAGQDKDIQKGMAVVNMGQSGGMSIALDAGSDLTRIVFAQHTGSPWSSQATPIVIGNMRDTFGTGGNNRLGIGMGDYSAKNYMSYNAKNAGQFVVVAGGGGVFLNENGLVGQTGGGDWTFKIDTDGDAFFGSNIAAPATTAFAVFANAQNYNSGGDQEAMGAGDVLLGDNSSSKANILWDKSTGKMLFRSGTDVHTYIGTDGAFYGGGGSVKLDADGLVIKASGLGYETDTTIRFISAGDIHHASIYAYEGGGGANYFYIIAKEIEDENNDLYLIAQEGDIILAGNDTFTKDWTDFSTGSNPQGFASFTTKKVWYKKIGRMVWVSFQIVGTSNQTYISFTLPYTIAAGVHPTVVIQTVDAGTTQPYPGLCQSGATPPTASMVCYKRVDGLGFSSTGIKGVIGQFWYQATA